MNADAFAETYSKVLLIGEPAFRVLPSSSLLCANWNKTEAALLGVRIGARGRDNAVAFNTNERGGHEPAAALRQGHRERSGSYGHKPPSRQLSQGPSREPSREPSRGPPCAGGGARVGGADLARLGRRRGAEFERREPRPVRREGGGRAGGVGQGRAASDDGGEGERGLLSVEPPPWRCWCRPPFPAASGASCRPTAPGEAGRARPRRPRGPFGP